MKLIVGLGNPGKQYLQTRHNIGFVVVDFILQELKLEMNQSKFNGLFVKEKDYIIAKPLTYMNLSGDFVQAIAKFYKIEPKDILIIHDDMDHSIGKFAIRKSGSSGGQNGIKDIIAKLQTFQINRIKIGIGKNVSGVEHVLGKFTLKEKQLMNESLRNIIDAAKDFISHDIDYLMNKYNRRK